jgi:hypothetical protein
MQLIKSRMRRDRPVEYTWNNCARTVKCRNSSSLSIYDILYSKSFFERLNILVQHDIAFKNCLIMTEHDQLSTSINNLICALIPRSNNSVE